jgi:phosphohistidine phosphatase SixA
VTIYLVRHAHAGDRSAWGDDDRLRPLSPRGTAAAEAIAGWFDERPVTRLVSSPSLRCLQTLGPLSRARSLEIEADRRVEEGAEPAEALALVRELSEVSAVVCSHGDVIPDLLDSLRDDGTKIVGRGCEKGSIWQLDTRAGRVRTATYVGRFR